MSKPKKSDSEQRQFWQMAIETWRSTGLSVRKFCKQEGLSEPAFYSWRKKLSGGNEADSKSGRERANNRSGKEVPSRGNDGRVEEGVK